MCEHGNLTEIIIKPKPFKIKVDSCLREEIKWLNQNGVYTAGCCCGHGKRKPTALIYVNHGSFKKSVELGYTPQPYTDMLYQIELKNKKAKNLLEVPE